MINRRREFSASDRCSVSLQFSSRVCCFELDLAITLAPPPALVGYSLVGVYPCAVWQPQTQTGQDSIGPIRNQRDTNNRSTPYPSQSVQIPVQIAVQPQTNTVVQPQVVLTACNCTNTEKEKTSSAEQQSSAPATSSTTTPMLFVPFTVPAFAPTMAATAVTTMPNMGTPKVIFRHNFCYTENSQYLAR
ncbi:hypothetical protein ABEB36_010582 [Hypothenemus hampei]|uniref:Uncharacterized protein n=1 Tax=Hypothenemus hampei TaxID=57062 RepID=A0ABD1ECE4_HYPHA